MSRMFWHCGEANACVHSTLFFIGRVLILSELQMSVVCALFAVSSAKEGIILLSQ